MTHKWFLVLYGLSALCGLVAAICFGLVWSHWHSTLNGCYSSDCGCFLYVTTTPGTITGSNIMVCWFITYAHLAIGLGSCGMVCGYYVTMERRTMARKRAEGRVYQRATHSADPCSIPLALVSGLVLVLLLTCVFIFTEGYIKTCSEYRRTVVRYFKASGSLVDLISSRFPCSSILDAMDYTQPSTPLREPRGGLINTARLLEWTGVLSWTQCGLWVLLLAGHTALARRRYQVAETEDPL